MTLMCRVERLEPVPFIVSRGCCSKDGRRLREEGGGDVAPLGGVHLVVDFDTQCADQTEEGFAVRKVCTMSVEAL